MTSDCTLSPEVEVLFLQEVVSSTLSPCSFVLESSSSSFDRSPAGRWWAEVILGERGMQRQRLAIEDQRGLYRRNHMLLTAVARIFMRRRVTYF